MVSIIATLLILAISFGYVLIRIGRRERDPKLKNNRFIKDWMALSGQERRDLDFKDKKRNMEKKKALLKSIREEYKRMKKSN